MKYQGWIAFDQWINALAGGWADETISARAYRRARQGIRKWEILEKVINGLFFWERGHCHNAYVMEVSRMQMPPAYREDYLYIKRDVV
jgi:hypothetical protein